jgi:hypothetical protein
LNVRSRVDAVLGLVERTENEFQRCAALRSV